MWSNIPRATEGSSSEDGDSYAPPGKNVHDHQYLYEITDGDKGIGDICRYLTEQAGGLIHGKKWRMPTSREFAGAHASSGGETWNKVVSNNAAGMQTINNGYTYTKAGVTSTTFFPASGMRDVSGSLKNVNAYGYYWSGSLHNADGHYLLFWSDPSKMNAESSSYANYGYSVRCVVE